VVLDTDNAGTGQRMFVYGDYIDEVVVVFDWTAPVSGRYAKQRCQESL